MRTIFEESAGKPLTDEARVSVLMRGLQHEDEAIRLASAFSVINNRASEQAWVPAVRQLAYLSTHAVDPGIQHEATKRLEQIQTDVKRRLSNAEYLAHNAPGKTEAERQERKEKATVDGVRYKSIVEGFAKLSEDVKTANEGALYQWDTFCRTRGSMPAEKATEELNQLVESLDLSYGAAQAKLSERVAKIFGASLGAKVDTNNAKLLRTLVTESNERDSLAAATALTYRSENPADRKFGIENLTRLEANAKSATLKKEAGVLLDRFVAELEQRNAAKCSGDIQRLVSFVQIERQRAFGLPVTLEGN